MISSPDTNWPKHGLIAGDVQITTLTRPTIVMCVCTFNEHIDHHEPQLKATRGETKAAVLIFETVTQTMDSIDYNQVGKYADILSV